MIAPFGQVISTRILRDNQNVSRGVGFARMESKEKCEDIIREFCGKSLPGKKNYYLVDQTKLSPNMQWRRSVVKSGGGRQCRIKVFMGPRLDTIMGLHTVTFPPIIPLPTSELRRIAPSRKCEVANVRMYLSITAWLN